MKATVELQVIPVGQGASSVRKEIMQVVALLEKHDFILETHASGTNIEGDLEKYWPLCKIFMRFCIFPQTERMESFV